MNSLPRNGDEERHAEVFDTVGVGMYLRGKLGLR